MTGKLIKTIISLHILLLIGSCSETTTTSNYLQQGEIKNELKVGEWHYYLYEMGVAIDGNYENGVKQGYWKYHYHNFGMTELIPFENGKITGMCYDVVGGDTVEFVYRENGEAVKHLYSINSNKDTIIIGSPGPVLLEPFSDETNGTIKQEE